MCSGGRLVADFMAGTDIRPGLPAALDEHLTTTVDGLWVVWAHKVARPSGDLFIPLRGGRGYPADARAECRLWRDHAAPDPGCRCGFHALSSRGLLPGLRLHGGFTPLAVALSGRVLAFEWAGAGVLWRAERQTVVRIERPARSDRMESRSALSGRVERVLGQLRRPDDPDGRLAAVPAVTPRDSGPIRLNLPVSCPVLPLCHDDAGWCVGSSTVEHSPASLVLA